MSPRPAPGRAGCHPTPGRSTFPLLCPLRDREGAAFEADEATRLQLAEKYGVSRTSVTKLVLPILKMTQQMTHATIQATATHLDALDATKPTQRGVIPGAESPELTVAIAQHAPVPGDIAENARRAATTVAVAAESGARLLLYPEFSLTGYDLDLLSDPACWVTAEDPRLDVAQEASRTHGVTTVVGAAWRGTEGGRLLASIALSPDGTVEVVGKRYLHGPERDLFQPGVSARPLVIDGWRIALAVCYDAAVPEHACEAA